MSTYTSQFCHVLSQKGPVREMNVRSLMNEFRSYKRAFDMRNVNYYFFLEGFAGFVGFAPLV